VTLFCVYLSLSADLKKRNDDTMETLTFLDPDDDDDLVLGDTQGDDYKFDFTMPSEMSAVGSRLPASLDVISHAFDALALSKVGGGIGESLNDSHELSLGPSLGGITTHNELQFEDEEVRFINLRSTLYYHFIYRCEYIPECFGI